MCSVVAIKYQLCRSAHRDSTIAWLLCCSCQIIFTTQRFTFRLFFFEVQFCSGSFSVATVTSDQFLGICLASLLCITHNLILLLGLLNRSDRYVWLSSRFAGTCSSRFGRLLREIHEAPKRKRRHAGTHWWYIINLYLTINNIE